MFVFGKKTGDPEKRKDAATLIRTLDLSFLKVWPMFKTFFINGLSLRYTT